MIAGRPVQVSSLRTQAPVFTRRAPAFQTIKKQRSSGEHLAQATIISAAPTSHPPPLPANPPRTLIHPLPHPTPLNAAVTVQSYIREWPVPEYIAEVKANFPEKAVATTEEGRVSAEGARLVG